MMLFPTPFSPMPIQALDDVSAFMIEITAAHVAASTAYHTFYVVASAGCKVYWGDGASSTLFTGANACTHIYASAGYYLIQVKGAHTRFFHGPGTTAEKVILGCKLYSGITNCYRAFQGCLHSGFHLASGFKTHAGITDMSYFFQGCSGAAFRLVPGVIPYPQTVTLNVFAGGCSGASFTFLPDAFAIPAACLNCNAIFDSCVNLTGDITNRFPTWASAVSVILTDAFTLTKVTGTAPADKLWNRSDITWTTTRTFRGCIHLSNYASIPSGWK